MGMKASEVGNWLRQRAGKRDHREAISGDYVVIRPGRMGIRSGLTEISPGLCAG